VIKALITGMRYKEVRDPTSKPKTKQERLGDENVVEQSGT